MTLERIELETQPNPTMAVIWLHGLGADGHDFEAIVPELDLGAAAVRFIFPHAPVRPVTINGGAEMRAWYDIDPRAPLAGDADIRRSAADVAGLIREQTDRGLAASQIVLAGFSQGGVIALHLGLRFEAPLAGIMALSTYLHDGEHLTEELTLENADTPIFMAHGIGDPMIPITRAVTSREVLTGLGYSVQWHEYAMAHAVCLQEIRDISSWLRSRIR
ncbi:MAG: carboxylesterase [Gammaproteobacteria bacterium]|nr:carboxylesterase [Gammaproteobacteria bacterium]